MTARRVPYLRCILLTACAGATLVPLLMRRPAQRGVPPPAPHASSGDVRMQGMRTVVSAGDGLRVIASARSVEVESPRAFGPLRLGFLRGVVASGVQIELLAAAPDRGRPLDLTACVKDIGAALMQRSKLITSIELLGVTITRSDADGTLALLHARRCRTDAYARTLVCWKGMLRDGAALVPFGEAVHDGRQWRITSGARGWPKRT